MNRDFDAGAEVGRLWSGCARYWEAEAGVVQRYLEGPRNTGTDVRWLRLAAFKETRLYRELPPALRACQDAGHAIPGMDTRQRQVLDQEMHHYHAIAGLLRALGARPPGPDEVLHFPADRRLQDARAALRTSGDPLARCASELVEGGGGAMYRVLAGLKGSAFDVRLAGVFTGILDDEMDHGPGHLPELASLLRCAGDAARLRVLLDELGTLRVNMRQEMFFAE